MNNPASRRKVLAYFAIIFFLTFIILFFIWEFRYIKKIIDDNESSLENIVSTEIAAYTQDLQFTTENAANLFAGGPGDKTGSFNAIAQRDDRISNIALLDSSGAVINSYHDMDPHIPGSALQKSVRGIPQLYGIKNGAQVSELAVVAGIPGGVQGNAHYLALVFNTNDFVNAFILKYNTDQSKVAIIDRGGLPLAWPFEQANYGAFFPDRGIFKTQDASYAVHKIDLENTSMSLYFFSRQSNFAAYRIITIMFLLFTLYFLIYQFIVELLNANNMQSYFENIDFNIFNHLKEGIIIANKFSRIVFANNIAYEIFSEKEIIFKKTRLKEIIGPLDNDGAKLTLKTANNLVDIISSPIFKNGKLLGALVVISPSYERDKLGGKALEKIIEYSQDGILFVDKEGKIMNFNLMANYYLGNVKTDVNINEANSELADLIENSIGADSPARGVLSFGETICELVPLYDNNGFYAGTVVFLKSGGNQ